MNSTKLGAKLQKNIIIHTRTNTYFFVVLAGINTGRFLEVHYKMLQCLQSFFRFYNLYACTFIILLI
jgi:hypothetical protein